MSLKTWSFPRVRKTRYPTGGLILHCSRGRAFQGWGKGEGSSEIPVQALLHSCFSPGDCPRTARCTLIPGICGFIASIKSGEPRRQQTSSAAALDLERTTESISGDCLSLSDFHNDGKERMISLRYLQTELICANVGYDTHSPGRRQTDTRGDNLRWKLVDSNQGVPKCTKVRYDLLAILDWTI